MLMLIACLLPAVTTLLTQLLQYLVPFLTPVPWLLA